MNFTGTSLVAGPMMVALESASRTALAVASASALYCFASGLGFQKLMFGSFQISQMMRRPVKCRADAAAQRANAATLSGCWGEARSFCSLPVRGFLLTTVSS